jgi:hypothetical protein
VKREPVPIGRAWLSSALGIDALGIDALGAGRAARGGDAPQADAAAATAISRTAPRTMRATRAAITGTNR